MAEQREFICVTCPVGCSIQAEVDGQELVALHGQACQRGEAFVREELTAPRRMLTTTVRVNGGKLPLVPVRSNVPVPKGLMFEIARALREVALHAPVADHQMVLENALGSGVDIVTSRGIQAI
jgi:CxxC motif-containing protein